jgi:hypothetical protein
MTIELLVFLTLAVLAVAMLYSSVGHAGASGYIAVMSLFGLAPEVIKPTALVLNILVATITTWQFVRAGRFTWSLFWPFALLAVPMAFLGGYLNLPVHAFKVLVGVVLLFSAARLALRPPRDEEECLPPGKPAALGVGAGLGLLAGLTGTGGGIFLTPLLIFMRWARATTAAGVSAPFILLNSAAGLAGNVSATRFLPAFIVPLALAVIAGGFAGSRLGSRRLPHTAIKRLLAVVLAIAGTKLILT